tara:strand:- start:915 stop:2729 length:1815 start_codon:yes stop_codon:yes gene_type:complete
MAIGDQIQLGSLDYGEIKNNLKAFLSDQEELKDYNFDGSILSTLVDLMAYNTMYYAFYSNMQANEAFLDTAQRTESLISLAKPLGYVVPHRKSATVTVTLTGVQTAQNYDIPRYGLKLNGMDFNGTNRVFYNLDPIVLSDATTPSASVTFYETKELVLDANVNVDLDNQKVNIFDTTVDPTGIFVKVNGEEWRKQEGIDANLNELSKVYFVEPTKDGYVIRFGGLTETGSGQIIGRGIADGDTVTVSYFSSNGSLGNNITGTFTLSDSNIQSAIATIASAGGFDSPNPDTIRFFAPRFFATQNRAVTVEDYRTLSSSILGLENDPSKFNAFGGEDLGNLPHLFYTNDQGTEISDAESAGGGGQGVRGEVYLSYVNPNGSVPSDQEQLTFLNQIKTKSVAGLALKYYPLRTAELVARISTPSQDEVNTFNSLFPDGFSTIDSNLFSNSGGRAFQSATMKFNINPNNLVSGKIFYKNKLDRNKPFVITPEFNTPRPDELNENGTWYDLSEITIGEPFSGAFGWQSAIDAAAAEIYVTGTGWFPSQTSIGTIFWDTGEIQVINLSQSPVDYGNIEFSGDIDFNASSQNNAIYAPHNLYLTSKLENIL